MVKLFIYTGFGILALGVFYGLFVFIKGLRTTDWTGTNGISGQGLLHKGKSSPLMKRLSQIWYVAMLIGFMFIATGITIGMD